MSLKPIVKVYLLPTDWDEERYVAFHQNLVGAAKSVPGLRVEGEDDFISIFPRDGMEKGLGTVIVIEVDVPDGVHVTPEFERLVARTFGRAVQEQVPAADIQCSVYKFSSVQGFWSGRAVVG